MAALDALRAEVARNTTVDASLRTLVQGLAAKLQEVIDAGGNPAELQALADEMKTSTDANAAAVVANTPSE